MLRMILGIALGFAAGYLYGSERARDEARRRFASAPEPVRRAAERFSETIDGSPMPDAVKQAATRATAAVQTATERVAEASGQAREVPQPTEVADRPLASLPSDKP
jgi:hypothetical protein